MKKVFLALTLLSAVPAFATEGGPQYSLTRPAAVNWVEFCQQSRFENYIAVADAMRDFVTPMTWAELYSPMKVKAAKAQIALRVNGPLSESTRDAIYELVDFVQSNQEAIDHLWEVEAYFEVVQDLTLMTETLARDLK